MKLHPTIWAAISFLLPSLACDSSPKTYPVSFVCDTTGGTTCPPGAECPTLPLGADTCGDLPGMFGHPATPETVGRPVGCIVRLSYGNPNFGNSQQSCTCITLTMPTSSTATQWICPG
jgi:hypothetical protein